VAGDNSSFFPREEVVENGIGDATVSINDSIDNDNGFLTYELAAYDDHNFGFSGSSTRTVQLVNFTTGGVHSDTAPVVESFTFDPTGPDTAPGTSGSLLFTYSDVDTLNLTWRLFMVSGDVGGSFSSSSGSTNTGSETVQVTYTDDVDTPTEPVVFLLRIDEAAGTERPQHTIATLLVEKGGAEPTTTTPTGAPIDFPFVGLFGNNSGTPDPLDALDDFNIFYNGNPGDPKFFRNPDLSGELVGITYVIDSVHESLDPSQINSALYSRTFKVPTSANGNTGNMTFKGYVATPGTVSTPSGDPVTGGAARYAMTFTTEDFREGGVLNLPTSGSMAYNVTVNVGDTSGNVESVTKNFTVIVP
jgi:hypothetical protein